MRNAGKGSFQPHLAHSSRSPSANFPKQLWLGLGFQAMTQAAHFLVRRADNTYKSTNQEVIFELLPNVKYETEDQRYPPNKNLP